MNWSEWFETTSYVVTVIGLPFAIIIFIYEQRRERQNEEEEIFQRLADEYTNFLKLVLDNSDLQLLRQQGGTGEFTPEQTERRIAIFGILMSIFECAYLLVYEERMDRQTRRMWLSWEDFMREWCRRAEFRAALPELMKGEDEDFCRLIARIAAEEANSGVSNSVPGRPSSPA